MSFTYDQLKTAIQDYAENDETSFVNNLPVFIRQAEERILKKRAVEPVQEERQRQYDAGKSIFSLSE